MGNVCKGVMVYADDTNVIAHTFEDLMICIFIIERYCSLYDICINAKKTKWMLFGEPRSIVEDEVKVNGIIFLKKFKLYVCLTIKKKIEGFISSESKDTICKTNRMCKV